MDEISRIHGVNPSVQYIRTNLRKNKSCMFSMVAGSEICGRLKTLDVT